jgi:hypothetical protein
VKSRHRKKLLVAMFKACGAIVVKTDSKLHRSMEILAKRKYLHQYASLNGYTYYNVTDQGLTGLMNG